MKPSLQSDELHSKYHRESEPIKLASKFSLIDLAGSERLLNEKN
jgi:hypothetical protein